MLSLCLKNKSLVTTIMGPIFCALNPGRAFSLILVIAGLEIRRNSACTTIQKPHLKESVGQKPSLWLGFHFLWEI